jgi:outer membrane lipoprotein-sorting protein
MSASSFSVLFGLSLLFTGVSVSAKDQAANSAVAEALSKIQKYPAYRLTRSWEAHLAPEGSGAMVPVKITETAVMLVARKGDVVRAHESSTKQVTMFPLLPISRSEKETTTTLNDGRWVYQWGRVSGPTKMVDADINRGAYIIESLYTALLKDDSLSLRGEESVNGQRCILLESSAECLQRFLWVDGKATIFLNQSTGFPVRITAKKQMSKAVVNYTAIETNPTYSSEMFVPPKNVVFKRVKGAEGMENERARQK